jgi:stage II sporulation protein M
MSYKRWLLVAAFLFGIGLVLGLATPTGTDDLLAEDTTALDELIDLFGLLPQSSVLVLIFIKNVSAVLISFAFSPVFCLVPVMALSFNGWLIGLVSAAVIEQESLGYLLAGLLPHGIFELPALITGEAAALSFGAAVVLALFQRERRKELLPNLKQNLKYLVIAGALFLPAAIIEVYVTPRFLG